jgi:multiple sugar transport system substrate-binding protein
MKKLPAIVSLVAILAILLGACAPAATPAPAATNPPAAQPTQPPAAAQPTQPPAAAQPTQPPAAQPTEAAAAEPVTLDYWQVDFTGTDKAIEAVIALFEAENPGIKINYTPISYDDINEKIAAMVPVGQGPDLVNPFFGWVPLWAKSGFLEPLPEDMFPKQELADTYLPAIQAQYVDGKLYGVPLNQSVWAILYNKDFFEEVGITKLPETFDELRDAAIKCTKRDDQGNLIRAGYFVSFGTQEHILWKVMTIKDGQPIFTEDQKTVTWNDTPTGEADFQWITDLVTKDKVMDIGFGDDSPGSAFYTGKTCMRLGSPSNLPVIRQNAPDLNFGSFPLPKGKSSDPAVANQNQTQYWSYNMTSKAAQDPAKKEAALKFLKFLTKPEASMAYIKIAGGLPVHKSLLNDPWFTSDPELAAFMSTLPNSVPLFWVDEKGERQLVLDMADKVMLNHEDPKTVFDWGTKQEQDIRDTYFSQ